MTSRAWRVRPDYGHYRKVVRPAVFARDGYRCRIALAGVWLDRRGRERSCTGVATEVHHELGYGVTGHDMRYMVAACRSCNQKVGDPTRGVDPAHKPSCLW